MRRSQKLLLFIAILIVSSAARAERPDGSEDALRSWQAPPFWASSGTSQNDGLSSSREGLRTKASTSVAAPPTPLPFVALPPCRIIDTRSSTAPPFSSGYGPPSMPGAHTQRSFNILGQCGIPADAQAVSFNFTVWAPVTRGDIRAFPAGPVTPGVATLNWEANIQALANAAIVALGTGGAITVQVDGPGTIDLIVDVNGYYAPQKTTQVKFIIALGGVFPSQGGGGPSPDTYIGEIKMFAGNYAPGGWALCDGQLLSIAQNQALFALLGTTYGGNGTTNFALPNLNGSVPTGY